MKFKLDSHGAKTCAQGPYISCTSGVIGVNKVLFRRFRLFNKVDSAPGVRGLRVLAPITQGHVVDEHGGICILSLDPRS